MAEEKSFKPSKRRLERARREGKVLKGRYFTAAAVTFAAEILICSQVRVIWVVPKILLQYSFADPQADILAAAKYAQTVVFQIVISMLCTCAVAGVCAEIAQVGVSVESDPLAPQFSRLNPVAGIKRIVTSVRQLWEPLVRITIVGSVGIGMLWHAAPMLACVQSGAASAILRIGTSALLKVSLALLGAAVLTAACDYFLQRRSFFRELSMSHAELREEQKDLEGSPLMKAVRRSMHESIAMQNLAQRVRQAKVIVVRKAKR